MNSAVFLINCCFTLLTLHIAIANSMFLLNVITMNKLYLEETVLLIYVENRF